MLLRVCYVGCNVVVVAATVTRLHLILHRIPVKKLRQLISYFRSEIRPIEQVSEGMFVEGCTQQKLGSAAEL